MLFRSPGAQRPKVESKEPLLVVGVPTMRFSTQSRDISRNFDVKSMRNSIDRQLKGCEPRHEFQVPYHTVPQLQCGVRALDRPASNLRQCFSLVLSLPVSLRLSFLLFHLSLNVRAFHGILTQYKGSFGSSRTLHR